MGSAMTSRSPATVFDDRTAPRGEQRLDPLLRARQEALAVRIDAANEQQPLTQREHERILDQHIGPRRIQADAVGQRTGAAGGQFVGVGVDAAVPRAVGGDGPG